MMVGWEMTVGAWIWMLFWIAALLVMVWLLVRQPNRKPPHDDAMTLLRERFARGEISQDEFERALDALRSDR
jgi:putative membrane protein